MAQDDSVVWGIEYGAQTTSLIMLSLEAQCRRT